MSDGRILTYCTNIHPGESWCDVMRNLDLHALAVKQAFQPSASFPLGLRISAQAAGELDADAVSRFNDWCAEHDCYVATVNGFPYGGFHDAPLKSAVYLPDWRDPRRADYTLRLADLLARWSRPGQRVSISTVPIAFRSGFDHGDWAAVRTQLIRVLSRFAALRQDTGTCLQLALEPEPQCLLETMDDVVACFDRLAIPAELSAHLALCFDCCHQAVEFEQPAACLARLQGAGVPIAKVQVSSALRASGGAIAALLEFDEPVYLHQAVLRRADGALLHFADLPRLAQWLAATGAGEGDECRVHFHVPIFLAQLDKVGTTRFFLEQCLPLLDPDIPLEVETYSFAAVPRAHRLGTAQKAIVRELNWLRSELDVSNGRH